MPAKGDILDPHRKLKGIYLMSAFIRKITSAFLLLFTVRLEHLVFVIVHTLGPIMISLVGSRALAERRHSTGRSEGDLQT